MKLNENKHPIPNCSVSLINYENGLFSIKKFADISYLENGIKEIEGIGERYE